MILNFIIPLLAKFLRLDYLSFWFFPLIGICFLATFPYIVRAFFRWR